MNRAWLMGLVGLSAYLLSDRASIGFLTGFLFPLITGIAVFMLLLIALEAVIHRGRRSSRRDGSGSDSGSGGWWSDLGGDGDGDGGGGDGGGGD